MTFLTMWEWLRSQALSLPQLAKFALAMAIIVGIPPLARRVRLPAVVGLLLCGVVLGPHLIGFFGERPHRPIADFFAELGKLLLMFFAGLEIDLALFRRARNKSIQSITTNFPLVSAAILALLAGKWIAAQIAGRTFGYAPTARMSMVTHVAAGGCDTRSHARRLRYFQPRRSTLDR
jgi:Kef-type K+ transport system membrane component KefB